MIHNASVEKYRTPVGAVTSHMWKRDDDPPV